MSERKRLRDLGFSIGELKTGILNSITDVPGVKVGHSTIIKGEGKLEPGKGPIRTGVTIILPHDGNIFRKKVRASSFVMNGYGKTIGLIQVQELGYIESVIGLTGTLNVPKVADALIDYHLQENPDIGKTTSSIGVVVGECNDGYLNDLQGKYVEKFHVFEAIKNASKNVEEGCIGAGTGMTAFGYKAGIGTSSRIVQEETEEFVVGVLVLSNFGHRGDLTILGRRIDDLNTQEKNSHVTEKGSIIVIIATNAPLTSRQLQRLAKRAPLGLSRTGSFSSYGSGDVIISFSTVNTINHDDKGNIRTIQTINESTRIFNKLLKAVVEATEEAVINSILKAETMIGRDNRKIEAISIEKVKKMLKYQNHL